MSNPVAPVPRSVANYGEAFAAGGGSSAPPAPQHPTEDKYMFPVLPLWRLTVVGALLGGLASCTQETQNTLGRAIQNWTGTNGVLDVYAGDKLVKRFIHIDKISTATATSGGGEARAYRYGYGVLDANQNYVTDPGEKKTYFEFSDFSTPYIFYENPL